MLKKILESLDTEVSLVVVNENIKNYLAFIESVDFTKTKLEQIVQPNGGTIWIMKMKYREYRRFMKRLQDKGRNLKQKNDFF